ncbi:MAG: sigma-54-dependent Fis family transcriptional regulator [Verrucomicrobia bacterium]|nr:sigma-54-dependent Fis family transcriptional regulator [Verrucomicrobiota bacterium]
METRRIWILEPKTSVLGESLRQLLESTGRYSVVRSTLMPKPGSRPKRRGADSPVAGFVVHSGATGAADLAGLPQRLGLPRDLPWFLVAADGEPDAILTALHEGFCDFLVAPLRPVDVLPRLQHHLEEAGELGPAPDEDLQSMKDRLGLGHIVGHSPALVAELRKLPSLARCEASVFIAGETGTGKELFARALHRLSPRLERPFVPVNCGALPLDLVENELFGHTAGAYTGAQRAAEGLVAEAEGGTLFLDEVDSLAPPAQVKLLRFLQEKEFRPVGARQSRLADVRVLAASNGNLRDAVQAGRFRADLFYRLNIIPIRLAPLRERREDISDLADFFLRRYADQFGALVRGISAPTRQKLLSYSWPGNIRELENVIQRAVVLADRDLLQPDDVVFDEAEAQPLATDFKELKARAVADFERAFLSDLLRAHGGNISHAAEASGKHRRAFWELMRKHGLTSTAASVPSAVRDR